MADPGLTARARLAIADLSTDERADWLSAEGHDGWMFAAENIPHYERIGLVTGGRTVVWRTPGLLLADVTDLGREVARLIAEQSS